MATFQEILHFHDEIQAFDIRVISAGRAIAIVL